MKGPKLAIVGSCVGCEDLRPLHTKRGAVIPAGCAQKNGKEVGGYTPAWCPELHAATVAHARELLAKEGKRGRDRVLTCADCGDPLNAPTTADECSAKHDGVAPRAPEVE